MSKERSVTNEEYTFRWSPEALEYWDEIEEKLSHFIREAAKETALRKKTTEGSDLITEEDMQKFMGEILDKVKNELKKDHLQKTPK